MKIIFTIASGEDFGSHQDSKYRSEPNTKSKILIKLKPGTKVEYLGESGKWLNIKLSTGITGWILKSFVTEQK